ncbi:MAG TPA: hypothetical protein VN376_03170, partial [Longilinea sp.]|nr:hypothetical protein [Longilinea sp.]
QLSVQESIQYTNRSMDTLNDLVLVVEPTFQTDLFTLVEASWSDGDPIENILPEAGRLTIPLQTGLIGGQSIDLQLTYTLNLPQIPGTLSFTDRQINLTGWYAYIPPYLTGHGWLTHTPSSVGEYQVYELADYTVQFRIDNAPAGLVVASSSEAVINSEWYEYHQSDARMFSLSISPYYQMIETQVGTTIVQEYYFSEDELSAQAVLLATSQAIGLYSQIFGSNDRNYLAVIEGTFPDGMEYDGMYYLGEEYYQSYNGNAGSYLVTIAVHETAHQWWFAGVINDQAMEPWLDEALCTYTELLYFENIDPAVVDWWWPNRIEYYGAQGYVGSTIYDYISFRPYVNAVYLNGSLFINELRRNIGDAAFFAFLQDYYSTLQTAGRQDHVGLSSADIFFEVLSRHTSYDITSLRSAYFGYE